MVKINMTNLEKIMSMLDWNMPSYIQSQGRILSNNVESIVPFIQPLDQKYNKNVWENCAIIISERNDLELKPHLTELMEWLQDMNWPGAFCIFDRLKKYQDEKSFQAAIKLCFKKAKKINDKVWQENLNALTK